jgi:hypothetical protein
VPFNNPVDVRAIRPAAERMHQVTDEDRHGVKVCLILQYPA